MTFFILKCGRLNLLNFDHFHEHNYIKSVFENAHRSAALRTVCLLVQSVLNARIPLRVIFICGDISNQTFTKGKPQTL